ncbi:MAG: AraC family transcriptional regulator ligand-binding domain-containing protein [Proteobacteria bacterium]|nr:AraC family transcriptional regulator ligand-binding domain-containing protein [Pseudomonadota bacterium]
MNGRAARPERTHFVVGNDLATPVRFAYGLGPLILVLEAAGHDIEPLLLAADIPPFALEEPSYRVRVAQETLFTSEALARLARPDAGLLVGQRYHMVTFGVLGLAAASAPTVRELLRTLLFYPLLSWGMCHCSLWSDGAHANLQFEPHAAVGEALRFYVGQRHHLHRDPAARHARRALSAAAGALPSRRAGGPAPYQRYFDCPLEFGAAVNEVCFKASDWNVVPPQADRLSFRFYDSQCRRMSEALLMSLDYADVVRSRLRAMVPMPSLSVLAANLRLTERTLQRRLASASTSYSELLREVRLEQARRLMRRERVHIDEIAYRLGFEDAIAFSHAFKEWTGQAPRDYRRALRAAGTT